MSNGQPPLLQFVYYYLYRYSISVYTRFKIDFFLIYLSEIYRPNIKQEKTFVRVSFESCLCLQEIERELLFPFLRFRIFLLQVMIMDLRLFIFFIFFRVIVNWLFLRLGFLISVFSSLSFVFIVEIGF